MSLYENIQYDMNKIKDRKTKSYRDIAKKYKKELSSYEINEVYTLCESLLDNKTWGETTIAYQIILDSYKKYNENTFEVFEKWLYKYIEDWWDCDDFMTHGFQLLLMKYPKKIDRLKEWIKHERFAVRRSAAVILIRPAQKGLIEEKVIFEICDLLIDDPHYLAQKGYGWLLKESVKYYHDSVITYLENNVSRMSRIAFRYALEKLSKEEKARLMKI